MNLIPPWVRSWGQDKILKQVVRNSSYLFSSTSISLVLSTVQSVLAARLLGASALGLLGIITSYTSMVNRLFSFRMGELVVRYTGEYLEDNRRDKAGALIKAAALVEAITSLAAFLVLVLLAPMAARYIAKSPESSPLIIIYGLSILVNFTYETSTGVLEVANRFRSKASVNLAQSALTAGAILAAFIFHGDLMWVLLAYLAGKVVLGLGTTVMALGAAQEIMGPGWYRAPLWLLPRWKELRHFALNTNLAASVNLVARDSELLWIGYFLTTTEAGLFKVAYAVVNLVVLPITPFISTAYPEINRAVVQRQWSRLRDLLRKLTSISGVLSLATVVGLVVFGRWVLWIYGPEYVPAYPGLLVLLAGSAFNYTLFWNRSLLLALGDPAFPFRVTLWAGLAKVALGFALVPRFGYLVEAALLSIFYVITVGLNVLRGWKGLRRLETPGVEEVPA